MADPNSILNTVGNVGDVINGYNQNAAQGRVQAGLLNQAQALAAANIYKTQLGAALGGPTESAKSTALGDTMANVKPFSWGEPTMVGHIPVPTASGGLTPANFGPNTRQAGADLSTLSAARVNSPTFNLPAPPTLPPIPSAGPGSSILGTAGFLAQLAKAAGGAGAPGSGGSFDLSKLINMFRGNGGSTNGNTGQPIGDFTHNLDNPPDPAATTSGVAFGPDGQPLPNDSQLAPYYDDATGQMVYPDPSKPGAGQGDTGNWWDE